LKRFFPLQLRSGDVVFSASPHVDDIDGDGRLEMVIGGSSGCIYVFEFGDGSARGVIDVPQFKRDPKRQARWW